MCARAWVTSSCLVLSSKRRSVDVTGLLILKGSPGAGARRHCVGQQQNHFPSAFAAALLTTVAVTHCISAALISATSRASRACIMHRSRLCFFRNASNSKPYVGQCFFVCACVRSEHPCPGDNVDLPANAHELCSSENAECVPHVQAFNCTYRARNTMLQSTTFQNTK